MRLFTAVVLAALMRSAPVLGAQQIDVSPSRRGRDRRRRVSAVLGLIAAGLSTSLAACGASPRASILPVGEASFELAGVRDVVEVSQLTGPSSPNRTDRFEVAGQDLGSMFEAGGKTWFAFGDTFSMLTPGMTGGGAGTGLWRSNTLAYTTDTDPTDGITFDGYVVDDTGAAKELLHAKQVDYDEFAVIPTHGFAANGAMYLHYMAVKHFESATAWSTNYSGLATSTDGGETWTKLAAPRWPGDSNFIQVSVAKVDNDLYFWGATHGRLGGVQLMSVPEQDVERQDAYRYFSGVSSSGEPQWSADIQAAETIVDGTVGELSVVWNSHLERWLMTYTDGGTGGASIREAGAPWGRWSDAMTLISAADVPGGLYAPFMHATYTANDGKTIYFTLSKWGPYNVFWYRADLVTKGDD
ncbi:MAG TPA: DUF4185 domain-containing protein [Candidatus Limnocylindrales bacterium]|nr:DUF4185 domain-containing protein [Candidatus Limnocylindrales bacterium]